MICQQLNSKHTDIHASFKIAVHETNDVEIMNPELWPEGVVIRKFFQELRKVKEHPQPTQSGKHLVSFEQTSCKQTN